MKKLPLFFLVFLLSALSLGFIPLVKASPGISYSSGVITVVGETGAGDSWVNAYSFWDLWNASFVNGWLVANKTDSSENVQFDFGCRIQIGDGSTATYFWDMNVQVTFNSTAISGNSQRLIDVRNNGHFRLGQLDDASNKLTSQGCQIIALDSGYTYPRLITAELAITDDVQLYSSSFISTSPIGNRLPIISKLHGNPPIYNCYLDGVYFSTTSIDGSRITVTRVNRPLSRVTGTFDDLYMQKPSTDYIYFYGSEVSTLTNIKGRESGYKGFYILSLTVDETLINADLDLWTFSWSGTSTGKVIRQYEFDLTVTFPNGSIIENANVTLSYYGQDGGTIGSWLTDSNGQIPQQTLTMGFYNQTGGDTIYDYNPYHLEITNTTGYQDYSGNFTLSEKTSWEISLQTESATGGLGLGLGMGLVLALMVAVGVIALASKK